MVTRQWKKHALNHGTISLRNKQIKIVKKFFLKSEKEYWWLGDKFSPEVGYFFDFSLEYFRIFCTYCGLFYFFNVHLYSLNEGAHLEGRTKGKNRQTHPSVQQAVSAAKGMLIKSA